MPKYILDPGVEDELWGLWRFIAHNNSEAATRFLEAACATFQTLAATPGLGRLRRFRNPRLLGIRSCRILGFENHLIFYRGIAGGIQVNHVYQGAPDLEAMLGEK